MTETVVYEVLPPRFVLQFFDGRNWEDEESFDSLDDAIASADKYAALFVRKNRVVDRGVIG